MLFEALRDFGSFVRFITSSLLFLSGILRLPQPCRCLSQAERHSSTDASPDQTNTAGPPRQAFRFCVKYQRKTEFRKLCEILRKHLDQLKLHSSSNTISLNNVETHAKNMETWLAQLDNAITMELWQVCLAGETPAGAAFQL